MTSGTEWWWYVCNTDLTLLPHSDAFEVLLCPSGGSPPKLSRYMVSF